MGRAPVENSKNSKAIGLNARVCFDCGKTITDPEDTICPRCFSLDIDNNNARPIYVPRTHEVLDLPFPFSRLKLPAGAVVLLAGGPGSGKTTMLLGSKPTKFLTSEQQIDQAYAKWYSIHKTLENMPLFQAVSTAEEVEQALDDIGEEDRIVLDSLSQLTTGPYTAEILKRVIEKIQKNGARGFIVAQYTKDGDMLGPNELRHAVDVYGEIPDDASGERRIQIRKNRFGDLFGIYFQITDRGIIPDQFPGCYSVEGAPGNYRLHLYPMAGAKFAGPFDEAIEAGRKLKQRACAAIVCKLYETGFIEPKDVLRRKLFAEEHGLEWFSPEETEEES